MMTPVGAPGAGAPTPKRELVSAMAWLTIPALVGPLVGPPLGGFITTYFSWHWIFLINVPIGIIGIVLATRFLPRPGEPRRRGRSISPASCCRPSRFRRGLRPVGGQPAGAAADRRLSSPSPSGSSPASLYVRHARRAADPLLDLKLFRNPGVPLRR